MSEQPEKYEGPAATPKGAEVRKPLVFMHEGVPVTTTRTLADGIEKEHGDVLALVRSKRTVLEALGPVNIADVFVPGHPATYLNEPQAAWLLNRMGYTPQLEAFRPILEKAFLENSGRSATTAIAHQAAMAEDHVQHLWALFLAIRKVSHIPCAVELLAQIGLDLTEDWELTEAGDGSLITRAERVSV
jgi:hypothetical protein